MQEISFEDALKQLEVIVSQIEKNDIPLEEAFNKYKNGMELVKLCQEKLSVVEQKVKILDQETNTLKDFS